MLELACCLVKLSGHVVSQYSLCHAGSACGDAVKELALLRTWWFLSANSRSKLNLVLRRKGWKMNKIMILLLTTKLYLTDDDTDDTIYLSYNSEHFPGCFQHDGENILLTLWNLVAQVALRGVYGYTVGCHLQQRERWESSGVRVKPLQIQMCLEFAFLGLKWGGFSILRWYDYKMTVHFYPFFICFDSV